MSKMGRYKSYLKGVQNEGGGLSMLGTFSQWSPNVMCQLSTVTCHLSHVMCHLSHITFFSSSNWLTLSVEGLYQRGRPRLVFKACNFLSSDLFALLKVKYFSKMHEINKKIN